MPDYLRPLSEKQLRRRNRRDQQSVIGPLAKMIDARAASGARNLEGVYSRLAANLGTYQTQQADIYGRARTALEGYQTQGAGELQQSGGQINTALQQQMALSGQQGTIAPDLGRIASGQGVRGRSELGELALRQAAAENYAAQVPGFARLAGAQGIQQLQAQRQKEIADMTTQAQSSLLQSLRADRRQEYEKAVAARGFGLDYAKLAQDERQAARSAAIQRRNAATSERSASTSARTAAETARHNRNMERLDRVTENRQQRIAAETRRHNRAMEKIQGKGKKKSKSKSGL